MQGTVAPYQLLHLLQKFLRKMLNPNLPIDSQSIIISQYAYQKNHSTETALHHILDTCLDNINEGYIITM